MNLIKKLNSPAPTELNESPNFYVVVFSGLFIFLFLALFQPFGYSNIPGTLNRWVFAFGFGVVTSTMLLIYQLLFYTLFKRGVIKIENYLVKHSILNILGIIFSIAIGNYLFSLVIFTGSQLSWHDFFRFLVYTLIIGIFPTLFFPFYTHYKFLKKNLAVANQFNTNIKQKVQEKKDLEIHTTTKDEKIIFDSEKVMFFQAQGNYIQVVYLDEEDKPKKEMVRATMISIENDLAGFGNFIRVHRSYFVNMIQVVRSEGNAQGIKLFLKNTDEIVPVSRKFVNTIRNQYVGD